MLRREFTQDGELWWTRLPRIPHSVKDAKSLPQEGPVVFICDCEVWRGKNTLLKLVRQVKNKNIGWTVCVWHNERRDKMVIRRKRFESD